MEVFDTGALSAVSLIAARYAKAQLNEKIPTAEGGMENPSQKDFEFYWRNGKNALEIILQAMLVTGKNDRRTILDFSCGYGRVARHLDAAFPRANITAHDIYEDKILFCARELSCPPVLSEHNFNDLAVDVKFDLFWCGSLFTHLPEHKFRDCLALFSRSLALDGIAIFTTHGRHSYQFGRDNYLPASQFALVQAQYEKKGFGYADYNDAPSAFTNNSAAFTNNYGIALSSPAYIASVIDPDTSVRIVSFTERGWSDHQDVVVIQKKPVTD